MIVDRQGTPLAVSLTGGNRHDVTELVPLLDAIPPVPGLLGRPRSRPKRLFADRGYDFDKYLRLLWKRGIKPVIARRGAPHGSGLGRTRWVVERAFAWLRQFKRLRIRYGVIFAFGASEYPRTAAPPAWRRAFDGDGRRPLTPEDSAALWRECHLGQSDLSRLPLAGLVALPKRPQPLWHACARLASS